MAKKITIRVLFKHPQTGEITTFELKGQHIDIGGQAVPYLMHGRVIGTVWRWYSPDSCSQKGVVIRLQTG